MLKKKNIAMAMAAVSIATPVATAFAAPVQRAVVDSTNQTEIQAIKEKAYKFYQAKITENNALLKDKSEGKTNAGKAAYEIRIAKGNKDADLSKNLADPSSLKNSYSDFVTALDKLVDSLEENEKVAIEYKLNGRILETGEIVDTEEAKYTDKLQSELTANGFTFNESASAVGEFKIDKLVDGTPVAKIRISNDTKTDEARYITVKSGDVQLDGDRSIYRQANGYYIDKDGNALVKADANNPSYSVENGIVDGFYAETNLATQAIVAKVERDAIVKDASAVENVDMVVSDVYEAETGKLTVKGNEFINEVIAQRNSLNAKQDVIITAESKAGDKYTYKKEGDTTAFYKDSDNSVIASDVELVNVKFTFKVTDKNAPTAADWTTVGTVTLKPERKLPLTYDGLSSLDIETEAGLNRYKTAVEVSKNFPDSTTKEVVLVSGDEKSLVDGLTATPLAKSLNNHAGAPVLLTKVNEIPKEVIAEMKRLGTTTVYVVGGTSAVSDEVVNELKKVHGMTVKRLAGSNRYETSLEVAKHLTTDNKAKEAFVVGGHGEADALSIAAKAGKLEAPILLTKSDEISKDVELFLNTRVDLNNNTDGITKDVYVIGGTSVVSDSAYAQLVDIAGDVKRLAGERRQDTNAAVIKEFYALNGTSTAKAKVNNVIFAKSDNKGLVDALGAGALGAVKDAPVVLATDALTTEQEDVLETIAVDQINGKKFQVGYGVSTAVAKAIKAITKQS